MHELEYELQLFWQFQQEMTVKVSAVEGGGGGKTGGAYKGALILGGGGGGGGGV